MSEYPDIKPQTALYYSSSKGMHVPIYLMEDRHLENAIGVVQRFAEWQFADATDKDPDDTWRDFVPMHIYVPLVKEALRRFLTVPGEELLRTIELAWTETPETPPCCCICEYREGFVCNKEGAPKFGKLGTCLSPCDLWKRREEKELETRNPFKSWD
jgi:hypothetical protein